MIKKLWAADQFQFFVNLFAATRCLTAVWLGLVILGGLLPPLFGVAVGVLISAVQRGSGDTPALILLGVAFVAILVHGPVLTQLGANLGDRTAMWLHGRLLDAGIAPAGIAHLESAEVAGDLAVARDFDLGMSGPPLGLSLSIIANGLVLLVAGIAQAALLAAFHWWSALLIVAAWGSTHWLLRESTAWDRSEGEVQANQRRAEYSYRTGVDGRAGKEIRIFNLSDWLVGRFTASRRDLHTAQVHATRLRQRPLLRALLIVGAANAVVFWAIVAEAGSGRIGTAEVIVYAQAAIGASLIAFGGPSWALAVAASGVATVRKVERSMAEVGQLLDGTEDAGGVPAAAIRFRDVTFTYPGTDRVVLNSFDLTIPAGSSMAIVGLNGEGKTTLAKLLCRFYDPGRGQIEVDGRDLRTFSIESWRRRVSAVFQDYVKYDLSLRDNIAPLGASDESVRAALADAGADELGDLDTVLSRGYDNGTDLSGGQWQRIAIARTLCAVREGAGVVVLDEPTAQLDVRGEAEIFERVLAATAHCTTVLISHRFSTVRHADRICVVEGGRVVELGSHAELMELGRRYRSMFDLQASHFESASS